MVSLESSFFLPLSLEKTTLDKYGIWNLKLFRPKNMKDFIVEGA